MTTRREVAAKTLRDEGGDARSSIHAWRCEYPEKYGPCDCVEQTADLILAAADAADREAGIYRIRLDDKARLAVLDFLMSMDCICSECADEAAPRVLSVLRERAEQ